MIVDEIVVKRLGRVEYAPTAAAMREFTLSRGEGSVDELWLVEHPPVYTLGQGAEPVSVANGIPVVHSDRGGEVTYHGPGQVVGYPILDLNPDRRDVHRYVRDLEEVMIRVCADYGLTADRVKGFSGAWIGDEKIGAIGVRISRWITSHGFAFNVTTDIDFFNLIVPCGIADKGVTSLAAKLGKAPAMSEVEERFAAHFAAVFERALMPKNQQVTA